ncbi:MAG: TatD family hydrolase [Eubacterium sp.]|jgi:TatD DNase family protein|nr:TatD family hydrolase [Eubacterium sp.]
MLKLFDTHTHYDDEAYDNDRDELLRTMFGAPERGVAGFIAIGCSPERNLKAISIAEKYKNVYAAVGVHPGDLRGLPDDYIKNLRDLAKNKKTSAIGEIGLDYHYEGYSRSVQIKAFREQLDLATSLSLPVIIHSRDATADTLEILREYLPSLKRSSTNEQLSKTGRVGVVMHCFSGSVETSKELFKMGIMISFTGVLTFKNAKKAVEAAAVVPMEMLMLETDCPYMAPVPFRGGRCDSGMAWYIAEKLAEIKDMTTEEVVKICNDNAKKFFNISF